MLLSQWGKIRTPQSLPNQYLTTLRIFHLHVIDARYRILPCHAESREGGATSRYCDKCNLKKGDESMPRKPQVRYFASRGAYYTQVDGKQHKLATGPDDGPTGPTFFKALDTYKELLTTASVATEKDRSPLWAILEAYADVIEATRATATVRLRKQMLKPFVDELGERSVGTLTHDDVDAFLRKMRQSRKHPKYRDSLIRWGESSVAMFLKSVNAALNWAVGRKLITSNPVRGYEMPKMRSRSTRCLLAPADHQRVLTACGSNPIRELIVALEATGARPGELIHAEAKDWIDRIGAIVYRGDDTRREDDFRHKTAGECKDRIIRFHGQSLETMRELVKRYPKGPLFRNRQGKAWKQLFLNNRFRRLRIKLGLPDLIPYSYRHTFATRWLEQGGNLDLLAEIMGNSPATIQKFYRHITPHSVSVDSAFHAFFAGK